MNEKKVIYIALGSVLGLLLTVYFIVDITQSFSWSNVILYITFLFLTEGAIFGVYAYFRHQDNKQIQINQQKFQSRGVILKDTDNPVEVVLNQVERLNKELETKESQIAFMTSFTGQGILLIDHHKQIIYSNQVGDELLHLVDTKNNSYIVKIRFADVKSQIDETFSKNKLISREHLIDHKNLSVKTIPTGNTQDMHVLLLADDLSDKVNLQTIKKDFFNFAGHELKTPITILKGYAELIYHQIVSGEEALDIAGKMVNQTEVMTAFVDDMLMLSRLETYTDAPLSDVPLDKLLKETIEKFDREIKQKDVSIRNYIENIVYRADSVDMDKLFKNLVENAIKYNKDKGTIDIRLEKQGNKVIFTIQDSGLGIPKEEVDRIFERFYRVNQMRNIPGTGLGLSIVKHIVNKYHGSIDVDSELGKYTKFTISL